MATKKKARKSKKIRKAASAKVRPAKKQALKRRASRKLARPSAKKKTVPKKAVARKKKPRRAQITFSDKMPSQRASALSGDLQGLSNLESADSESVDELIEEGNAFEAGIVSGVQDAGDRTEKEVRTREVLEDDVPEEYLDQD